MPIQDATKPDYHALFGVDADVKIIEMPELKLATNDSPLVIDIMSWRMRDLFNWQALARKDDLLGMAEILTGVVKSWGFPADPTNLDSYLDLSLEDYQEVALEVSHAVNARFQSSKR